MKRYTRQHSGRSVGSLDLPALTPFGGLRCNSDCEWTSSGECRVPLFGYPRLEPGARHFPGAGRKPSSVLLFRMPVFRRQNPVTFLARHGRRLPKAHVRLRHHLPFRGGGGRVVFSRASPGPPGRVPALPLCSAGSGRGYYWTEPHPPRAVSQLALRDSGYRGRMVLRFGVSEQSKLDGVNRRACPGGYALANLVHTAPALGEIQPAQGWPGKIRVWAPAHTRLRGPGPVPAAGSAC